MKKGGGGQTGQNVYFDQLKPLGGTVPNPYPRKKVEVPEDPLHDKPFSQKAKNQKWGTFNNPLDVYGEDVPIPARPPKAKPERPELHDRAFRTSGPPKKGKLGTLGKFPEHRADPPRVRKPIKKEDTEDQPPGFKTTKKYMSRPTPSVATNFRNLKASFPTAFVRCK